MIKVLKTILTITSIASMWLPSFAQTQVDSNFVHEFTSNESFESIDDIPSFGMQMLETEPVPLNLNALKQMIGYPSQAIRDTIEGMVIVKLHINEQGNVIAHEVRKNPHDILTNVVLEKVYALRFFPGILDSKPIQVWITVPFDFRLTE